MPKIKVKWTVKDVINSQRKPGLYMYMYTAVVQSYNPDLDEIEIEYIAEQGHVYSAIGKLKLVKK